MRESGLFAVFALVSFFFIPPILAQKESRREPPSGWGAFKFIPCALAEARPLAFKPPFGFLPSLRVHAGDLAIVHHRSHTWASAKEDSVWTNNALTGDQHAQTHCAVSVQF